METVLSLLMVNDTALLFLLRNNKKGVVASSSVEGLNEGGACVASDGDSPAQLECGAVIASNIEFI